MKKNLKQILICRVVYRKELDLNLISVFHHIAAVPPEIAAPCLARIMDGGAGAFGI